MASAPLPRLALAAASVLLVLAVAELAARALYSEPWYQQLAAEQHRSEHFDYRLGELLLRDRLPAGPKLQSQRRVLVLGDSFTFGLGLRDDEAIFPSLIERRLNAEPPLAGVSRIDVLNAGRPGSLTRHWLLLWDELQANFAPDALLIVFFLRDGTRLQSNPEFFDRIRNEVVARNRASTLYTRSYLYRVVRDGLDRRELGGEYTRDFQDAYFGDEEATAEWRAAQRNLIELRDRARARGTAVGFAVFPVLAGLDGDYAFSAICPLLIDFADREGIASLSLLPAFMGRRGPELWVSPFDQHPNEAAHEIAADALLPFVVQLLESEDRERQGAGLP